ncbi:hypothetical protein [Amaricoccus macauensis]|uniref:hypothetical protein n=1 Tax=Amaricoccus macauensis TaxID=57001 RepID=UPI003C7E6132
MQTVTTSRTSTIAALYRDEYAAERTAARLESVGIPATAITLRSEAREADIADLPLPEEDRSRYAAGIERGCTLLLVADIATGTETSIIGILDHEAIDIDAEPQGAKPVYDTVGQFGGAGSATGEFDRLTGQRIGTPEGLHADEPQTPAGGVVGQATGEFDRLTGERIGGETDTAIPTHTRSRVYPK